jgi:hypothetical protein
MAPDGRTLRTVHFSDEQIGHFWTNGCFQLLSRDLVTGKVTTHPLHPPRVNGRPAAGPPAILSDGKRVVWIVGDELCLTDALSGQELARLPGQDLTDVREAVWHDDRHAVVVEENALRILHLQNGTSVPARSFSDTRSR